MSVQAGVLIRQRMFSLGLFSLKPGFSDYTITMISNLVKSPIKVILFALALGLSELLGANQPDWTVEKLMQQLSAISMVNLTFVERRKSEFLTEEMEINGNMVYRAPDYMEKNIESPFIENIVIDGDTITVQKTRKNGKIKKRTYSLTSHAALNTAVEGIRATMAGDFNLLSKNYNVNLQGECNQWRLILVPKNDKTLKYLAQIEFSGQEERIEEIETTDNDGEVSRLMFTYQLLQ